MRISRRPIWEKRKARWACTEPEKTLRKAIFPKIIETSYMEIHSIRQERDRRRQAPEAPHLSRFFRWVSAVAE